MLQLSEGLLLVISLAAAVMFYISNSMFAKKISKTNSDYYIYMIIEGLVCAIGVVLASGGIGEISAYSIIFGIIFGLTVVGQLWLNLKALAIGPFSYTSVLISLSTVIPTLSGIFWNETITYMQMIGIVLMVICILLSSDKDSSQKKVTTKWLVCCLTSAVLNGVIGVMQKIHQSSPHKDESPIFLVVTMLTMALFGVIMLIVTRSKGKESPDYAVSFDFKKVSHILIPVSAGIALSLCHVINLNLSGRLDAAVLFPIVNICPLVLTTFAARILFNEHLSAKRWVGIAIGILSTLFVSGVMGTLVERIFG